ncbi:hypothetical protein [Armatimonas sp.]|uniref:hypothetical protein n=1 Tax=Armatimonas sp. TaxID=1872638 RepID=UPI00374DC646
MGKLLKTMKRSKKITLALLGIVASVGLWSLIASPYQAQGRHAAPKSSFALKDRWTEISPGVFTRGDSICYGTESYYTPPTPAPKKPLQRGDERIKCDKCGKEYDISVYCMTPPTDEQIEHFHLTPQDKAQRIKAFSQMEKDLSGLAHQDKAPSLESIRRNWGLTKEDFVGSETKP